MSHHILLADDDLALCELLQEYLELEGFSVSCEHRGDRVASALEQTGTDLLVLDIMLPGMNGLDVLRQLRANANTVPVLMLTARGDDTDRIVGLELGADDYLPKPCNPRELAARIRAVLRRQAPADAPEKLASDTLWADRRRIRAGVGPTPLELTRTEFNCLWLLLANGDVVTSKQALSEQVLGRPLETYDRSVDMHLSKLRRKLQAAGFDGLKTVRGVGYALEPSV